MVAGGLPAIPQPHASPRVVPDQGRPAEAPAAALGSTALAPPSIAAGAQAPALLELLVRPAQERGRAYWGRTTGVHGCSGSGMDGGVFFGYDVACVRNATSEKRVTDTGLMGEADRERRTS